MTIDQTLLLQIASDLCGAMLGFDVAPVDSIGPPESDAVRATIRISGDIECLLQVDAPVGAARLLRATMFGDSGAPEDELEVLDAVGEIANIIGGNVKGVFDADCRLSIPCVGRANESPDTTDGTSTRVCIACDGQPMSIGVTLLNTAC